ncbi:chorismate-binding protein [Maribacter sp. ACAM166]|uniref:chorismate-binding protein n=1 Tax=Maribacter sp. ACAM166 TaxID=2508996 RepID=UPI0010FD4E0C|nr:chorismate-binding protein [Maribacter sp. ACAM166]TLP77588.1 isochorismate synthase [Maribacter sp. ACAM166]
MVQEIFDRAASCLDEGLPFVIYRKPNASQLTAIFQNNNDIHFVDDFSESGFVFAPFNVNADAILLHSDDLLTAPVELNHTSLKVDQGISSINETDREGYMKLVTKAIEEIRKGEFDKVVLSRKIVIDCNVYHFEMFQRMLNKYSKAFCYLWHHPKIGTWMGATPEILINTRGAEFTTISLAGTQSSNEFVKPQWTNKELNEQQMVTDYIIKALKDEVSSITTSEVESIQAGQLWHLRTKLNGRFAPNKFGNLLRALHPTPAVCGTPMEKARKFISENEFYDRAYYTGFLGELNFKNELSRNRNRRNQENSAYRSVVNKSELFVNLRCMQVHADKVSIYVGGGITSDSNYENEWDETVLKSNTMFRVLNDK